MIDTTTALRDLVAFLSPVWLPFVCYRWARARRRRRLLGEVEDVRAELRDLVVSAFLVQPCPRCHESDMRLIEVSPNARSVQYACRHCSKRMRAAASSPTAREAVGLRERLDAARAALEAMNAEPELEIEFETVPAPLPFEQTRREPIAETVRAEVWRRDGGVCVACGSRENLQFDHIIPVARGGATSTANLQLMCRPCNQEKAARI